MCARAAAPCRSEAAFDGNSKLEFGIQWQEVLSELSVGLMGSDELSEADLRAKFDEIDTSGDGSLDVEELAQVFVNIGAPVAEEVIENLVHLADEDGNGTIEWDEFVNIFKVLNQMKAKSAL
jgi:Ca2+-binding EF-hand superfamily protein